MVYDVYKSKSVSHESDKDVLDSPHSTSNNVINN